MKALAGFLVSYVLAALAAGLVFNVFALALMNHPADVSFIRRIVTFLFLSVSIATFTAVFALLPSIVAAVILWKEKAASAAAYMVAGFVISIVASLPLVGRGVSVGELWPIYPAGVVAGWVFWKVSRALGLRFDESSA